MTESLPSLQKFLSREDASSYVADKIGFAICDAIKLRGRAVILLSGGNTPRQAYKNLAAQDLPWGNVTIVIVDDRCVTEDSPGSNQAMIKNIFSQGPAREVQIIDLITFDSAGEVDLCAANTQMKSLTKAADLCLMGMGLDGHTASWFPQSKGLQAAMDINSPETVTSIDAAGCAGAGEYPDRLTLTLPAVMRSRKVLVFITGDDKAKVFTAAASKSVYSAPVKALFSAGPRFHTVWAP